MSAEVMEKIKERGYWEIVMKPGAGQCDEEKFTFGELEGMIEYAQVRYRYMHYPLPKTRFGGYGNVGTRLESHMHYGRYLSLFRFYRSGKFVHYLGMPEDRLGDDPSPRARWDPAARKPRPDPPFLDFGSTMCQLTEVFLFASKLAARGAFGDRVRILIKLHGTNRRILTSYNRPLKPHECGRGTIEVDEVAKTPYELWRERDKLAVSACIGVCGAFGLSSAYLKSGLEGVQEAFYNGRGAYLPRLEISAA